MLALVRHAIAEPRGPGVQDAARALTDRGRERFEQEVRGLRRLGLHFTSVHHSPMVRAVETAALMEDLADGRALETPLLARAPSKELLGLCRGERVAMVGHQPWLSELLAWLVLGDKSKGSKVPLKRGGVALLEGTPEPGGMVLRALLQPKLLRGLGR